MKKKDPTIEVENSGCSAAIYLMIIGVITGIIMGVSNCSRNERLEDKIEKMESKQTSDMAMIYEDSRLQSLSDGLHPSGRSETCLLR